MEKTKKMKDIAIFGAGGQGRETLAWIKDINGDAPVWNVIGFFDDDSKVWGKKINDYPVLGGMSDLNTWTAELGVVVSVGSPLKKKKILDSIQNPLISYPSLIHPSAIIGDIEHVKIGQGSVICAGTVVTTNIEIGEFVLLNFSCTVGHDAVIGNYSSIMPSANISGEVVIGSGTFVGTGAQIINRINIGENVIIGAGSVVVNDLPSNCEAVGVPARTIKHLSQTTI